MKRRFFVLLGLVLAIGLAWLFLMPRRDYRREVEAYKQELRDHGEKMLLSEVTPPHVVGATNAAMTFFGNPRFPTGVGLPGMMTIITPGIASSGTARAFLRDEPAIQFVSELRRVLDAPSLNFNLDYSQGFTLVLPHLARLKTAEIYAANVTMEALYRHDSNAAAASLDAAVDLVRLYEGEPLVISSLVRIADASIAASVTWEFLQSGTWTDAQLAEVQARWEAMDLFKGAELAMTVERSITIKEFAQARATKYRRQLLVLAVRNSAGAPAAVPVSIPSRVSRQIRQLYDEYPGYWSWKNYGSYEEELYALQSVDAAINAVRQVTNGAAFIPARDELRRQQATVDQMHPARTNRFLGVAYSGYESYLTKLASAEAARRIVATAIALKRYQLAHGHYPATLADMVPNQLQKIPIDFMDGKPLRYQLLPDGNYLLYSIGEDGEDNNGDGTITSGSSWMRGRDMVWPRVATPEEIQKHMALPSAATNSTAK